VVTETKEKRAWEVGIGASIFQFSRVDFTTFQKGSDNYQLGLQLRHSVLGPNLYIARELNPYFYLDLQGSVGFTEQYIDGKDKMRTLHMIGPGLQWRLGEYFDSKYIDPFFRVGVSYMKKNFDMKYQGTEGNLPEEMSWVLENLYNKDGVDHAEMFPVSFGVGMNAWLNDRLGLGLQGDYLMMPYKNVANSLQGTVRLIWRMGGKSKKRVFPAQYIEVEKIIQGPTEYVEKIVEVPVSEPASIEICELFNNVYFEFDKSDIRPESEEVLDKIADIMKANADKKYLITGYTDARGSAEYNIGLSRRRAAAVVEALQKRGVSADIIKSRGVGKRISYAPVSESHIVREGDRKVTVEIINNMDYWNFMPKRDY
jgi:outer membrane protein OmpA-like peptidoglycan-associated protein